MKKSEFVALVASKSNLTKEQANNALDVMLETIQEMTKELGFLSFTGFGKFKVIQTKKREGKNPQTGDRIIIPAGKRVGFSAGRKFKDIVNS